MKRDSQESLAERTPSRRRVRIALPALLAASALVLAACSSSSSTPATTTTSAPKAAGVTLLTPPSATVSLSESGSSLLFPLFNAWGAAYTLRYPNITVSTASTGSGTGISSALSGTVDIGTSDAYLSPGQVQATPGAMNVPLAVSAQFVGYNVPGLKLATGSTNLVLSGPVLSEIYQGKVTNWDDASIKSLNPGATLPNLPIVTLHRADGSGDTFLFSQFLSKTDPSGWGAKIPYGTTINWPAAPGALGETGNSGMVQACGTTPGCVAYIGISYEGKSTSAGIGVAALKNAAGKAVTPTPASINAAAASFASKTPANGTLSMIGTTAPTGYPIINYEYAIVLGKQPSATTGQAIKALLSWIISPTYGQSSLYLDPVGFVPLQSQVATGSMAQINSIS